MNASHLSKVLALSFCVIITGCTSSKVVRTLVETENSTQAIDNKEVDNVQTYENVQSTFTDCEGSPTAAWVLISPRAFPESLSGKFALLKFQVDDESKPYDVNLIEGDTEIADWSTKALMRSKFPNKPSSCWLVKYEYIDGLAN